MSEHVIDIVPVPDPSGLSRWQAVVPRGSVAGVASLRPIIEFGHDLHLFPASGTTAGSPELSLYVEPRWRRRGIGSQLLATVLAQTAESRLVVEVTAGSPGEAFCLRHGFRRTWSGRRDVLTYCDVHQAWLGELVDAEHDGYRLVHWTGDLPRTPSVEELLRIPSRSGNAMLTAADADGDLEAYAVMVVGDPSQLRARQYGPAVLSAHRGRWLGTWVNAALIRRLREIHPHVNEIETATADGDAHLRATLQHLGFHPFWRTHRYELALP